MNAQDQAHLAHPPKKANFGLVVVLASIALVVLLFAAYFLLRGTHGTMVPHKPNPTPNSLLHPLIPQLRESVLS